MAHKSAFFPLITQWQNCLLIIVLCVYTFHKRQREQTFFSFTLSQSSSCWIKIPAGMLWNCCNDLREDNASFRAADSDCVIAITWVMYSMQFPPRGCTHTDTHKLPVVCQFNRKHYRFPFGRVSPSSCLSEWNYPLMYYKIVPAVANKYRNSA